MTDTPDLRRQQLGTCEHGAALHKEGQACIGWKPALPELLEKARVMTPEEPCYDTEAELLARGAQPEPDERAFAKKWLADHQLEPLKCEACGQAQSLAPMASGDVWAGCPKAPAGYGHTYTITIGGENKEFERYAACISDYLQARAGSSPAPSSARTVCAECYEGAHGQCIEQGCYCNCQAENL